MVVAVLVLKSMVLFVLAAVVVAIVVVTREPATVSVSTPKTAVPSSLPAGATPAAPFYMLSDHADALPTRAADRYDAALAELEAAFDVIALPADGAAREAMLDADGPRIRGIAVKNAPIDAAIASQQN